MDITKKLAELEQRIEQLEARGGQPHQREVEQFNLETGERIAVFPSLAKASRTTKICNISMVCHGHMKHAGGFGWRFTGTVSPRDYTKRQPGRPIKAPGDIDRLVDYVNSRPAPVFAFEAKRDLFDGKHTRLDRALANALEQGKLVKEYRGKFTALLPAHRKHTEKPEPAQKVANNTPIGKRPRRRRAAPRWFPELTEAKTHQALDMAATGANNNDIAKAVGISAGMAGRLRSRRVEVEHYWGWIDSWLEQHPGADLRTGTKLPQ